MIHIDKREIDNVRLFIFDDVIVLAKVKTFQLGNMHIVLVLYVFSEHTQFLRSKA